MFVLAMAWRGYACVPEVWTKIFVFGIYNGIVPNP